MGIRYLVTDITPANNASNVPVSSSVVLTFAEAMNVDTLNDSTVYISSATSKVVAAYSYIGLDRKLTITPVEPLTQATVYTVHVLTESLGPKTIFGDISTTGYSTFFVTENIEAVTPPEEPTPETPAEPVVPIEPGVTTISLIDTNPKSGQLLLPDGTIGLLFSHEINPSALTANLQITKGDVWVSSLETGIAFSDETLTPSKMHIIKPSLPLEEGIHYQVTVKSGLAAVDNTVLPDDIVYTFTTGWTQMYTAVESVRLIMGAFGDIYTDYELARLISQQSESIKQLVAATPFYNATEWVGVCPYAASQYVLYKTAYHSMLGQIIETSSGVQKDIRLGDLSIGSAQNTSSEVSDLLALFQNEIDRWWKRLMGISPEEIGNGNVVSYNFIRKAKSSVRGGEIDSNPEFITRVPFMDLGE